MRRYFTEQLESAEVFTEQQLGEFMDLRSGLYDREMLQKYAQRHFEHVGQKIVYFMVKGLPEELENPLCSGTLVKLYDGDLDKYKDCLEYVKTDNKTFPCFKVTDLDTYLTLKKQSGW